MQKQRKITLNEIQLLRQLVDGTKTTSKSIRCLSNANIYTYIYVYNSQSKTNFKKTNQSQEKKKRKQEIKLKKTAKSKDDEKSESDFYCSLDSSADYIHRTLHMD